MNKLITFSAVLLTAFATGNITHAATIPMIDSLVGDITIGTTGEQVIVLQDFLRAEGVFTLESTGYFGSITQNALKNYQSKNGVAATGMIDAATMAVMQTEYVSGEVVAKAAVARNPEQVPVALGATKLYLEGFDVEAEGAADTVKQLQWAISTLERIMR
jgi:peptidoglycan hydrolase-like protein with peptidoglycan-binding domain